MLVLKKLTRYLLRGKVHVFNKLMLCLILIVQSSDNRMTA